MKKQLLASTALAAVGALALSGAAAAQDKKTMKPSLTVGGYWEANVGVGDNDVDGKDGVGVQQDVEVFFKGKAPLDNGITISTTVELEGNTGENRDAGDVIDETKVIVSGDFGELRIGAIDEAGYEMTFGYHGSVSTGIGNQTLEFDIGDWVPQTVLDTTNTKFSAASGRVNIGSDNDTVAYYTPRFNGFQMGVSYSRSNAEDDKPLHGTAKTPAKATPDVKEGVLVVDPGKVGYTQTDIVAAAVNYNQKHGDTHVGAAFGYVTADNPKPEEDDPQNWGGGLWVDFSNVRVGVGYVRHSEVVKNDEVDRWDLGGSYTWGPNAVSLGYIRVEKEQLEAAAGRLSYSRSLGPGVQWSLDALWAKYENDNKSQDGTAYTTGIQVKF